MPVCRLACSTNAGLTLPAIRSLFSPRRPDCAAARMTASNLALLTTSRFDVTRPRAADLLTDVLAIRHPRSTKLHFVEHTASPPQYQWVSASKRLNHIPALPFASFAEVNPPGLFPEMTTATYNDTDPFAVKFNGPRGVASYILGHQPKSFDWRARGAKPHLLKKVPEDAYARACETLNQIIAIGS